MSTLSSTALTDVYRIACLEVPPTVLLSLFGLPPRLKWFPSSPPRLGCSCSYYDWTRVVDQGLLDFDPFARIDEEGVGRLIRIGLEKARAEQPETKVKANPSRVV